MFNQADDMLTVNEAAELLKMGRGALYPLLSAGKLKGFRNGRVWRIPKDAVIQFIRSSSNLL